LTAGGFAGCVDEPLLALGIHSQKFVGCCALGVVIGVGGSRLWLDVAWAIR
jgi:hypothetical protein